MRRLISSALDWSGTLAAASAVFVALVAYDLLQRLAIRVGPHAHQRVVSHMAHAINQSARLCGTRFRVEGLEHVDPARAYLIVANHQSMFDIAMTSDYLRALEPRYVSKIELARGVPGISYNLRRGGSACIDRKAGSSSLAAIEDLGRRAAAEGFSVAIFPEGTRSRDGRMKPFRPSGLRALLRSAPGLQVLPITTNGGSRLFSRNLRPLVRQVELSYHIHPPVDPPDPEDQRAFLAFMQRLEEIVASGLPAEQAVARAAGGPT